MKDFSFAKPAASFLDCLGLFGSQVTKLVICACNRPLDQGQRAHELRIMTDLDAGYGKILDRPTCVNAPISLRWHVSGAQQVALLPAARSAHRSDWNFGDNFRHRSEEHTAK